MKHLLGLILFLIFATGAHASPLLVNGSLTGPIDNAGVPLGWSIVVGSPDTMDQDHNVGGNYGAFGATPSPSPDGGTWVGLGRDAGFIETFGQTVTGFLAGTSYNLSWYHANFGYSDYSGANSIEVLLDGNFIGSGSSLSLGTNWIDETLNFVATSSTHRIDFRLLDSTKSYHSIDGIRLSGNQAVPIPAAVWLLGTGLVGLAGARKRKRSQI